MNQTEFIPESYTRSLETGKETWSSPSNIALVKYWGKKPNQIPENPSISFTLDYCRTTTSVAYELKEDTNNFSFELYLDGVLKPEFYEKITTFLERIEPYMPFLKQYHFKIETSNSFPHSSGIASSASGMSALAVCFMAMEKRLNPEMDEVFFTKKTSFLSRLGSGSACRSLEGDLVVWGAHADIEGSSDLYGVKFDGEVHDNFKNYQDTILLVDKGEKQVSSTVGHGLMHGHPFAERRFEQAHENISKLKSIFKSGDLKAFMALVESEALTLHAMMMTSMPYFILMKPNTLEIINKIWAYRNRTDIPVCFTLDAGANVHMLYPENHKLEVLDFVKTELVSHCQNGHFINDQVGFGAKKQ
ncbi:MAG: diphosphomevalonate decarboxylase [Bacteroidetes bacterium MedPE-SWsnd-G2]|nr:MAG: diphosphomevalonate decarboxylase [Bacteroidetes bacterium MedPE-SWsnd-G2]